MRKRKHKHEPRRLRDMRLEGMFETRSEAWEAAGLTIEVDELEVRRAWRELALVVPLLIGVVIAHKLAINHITDLANQKPKASWIVGKTPIDLLAALAVLAFGWLISRDIARIAPPFFKRMDPGLAGTVGFLIRLAAISATVLGALVIAGINPAALAVGGAFTAVVLGLAAQQTLGNLFAGMVLLTARPFRLGELVRLQAGAVGGSTEGRVSSLGLLYTTLSRGDDRIMIPNNVVLEAVVVPLREPDAIDVKVRLGAGVTPSQVQTILETAVAIKTRDPGPNVILEEIDGETVTVRVQATPEFTEDGGVLADEIIAALADLTGDADSRDGSDDPDRTPAQGSDARNRAPAQSSDARNPAPAQGSDAHNHALAQSSSASLPVPDSSADGAGAV